MKGKQKRVHILTAVNAAQVSKAGGVYTIKDVCGAVDGIVMNSRLYPGDQLAASAATLEGKPAPAGHPKNAEGHYISAVNGDALLSSYIGSVCKNARHEGGRLLCDVVVNEAQANAHEAGKRLVERLDAAIAGTNTEPIHVSTGVFCEEVKANGDSGGKVYTAIAVNLRFDHLAVLLDQPGAGTPEEGVGMFLANSGEPEPVEVVSLSLEPADRRHEGLTGWIRKLLGNESELTFDQIAEGITKQLPNGSWLREVFAKSVVWTDGSGRLWRQSYQIGADGSSVTLQGEPTEVVRRVEYQPINPVVNSQETDTVKPKIVAALNAAGVQTEGLDDAQLLAAYNTLVGNAAKAPVQEQLTAVNGELKGFKDAAAAAETAKRDALVQKLATNAAGLTADELKLLPVATLEKLAGNAQGAAPILTGNTGQKGSEFAAYDLNAINEVK